MDTNLLQSQVKDVFLGAFGRTPTRQRLEDILRQALDLSRSTDFANMKEEVGDLLASAIMLCHENELCFEEMIHASLHKIKQREPQYHSLGRKINVVLIGGAFDPITVGHFKLAQFVLDTSKTFDEAWLFPCAKHLYGKKMASAQDRLEMVRLHCQHDLRVKSFSYEIDHDLAGETYHFAKRLLQEEYAKNRYDFSIAIGLDNANTFHNWVNYEDLERMMRFVVVSRQGVAPLPNVDWYLKPPHIYINAGNAVPCVSSTVVRNSIAKGLPIDDYVCPEVAGYIKSKGLYLPESNP